MAKSARFKKSRFSAGGPVSYLSLYLLDFYITVSIFILHNLLLLDSISFLLDSLSYGAVQNILVTRHFLTTKALQNHSSRIKNFISVEEAALYSLLLLYIVHKSNTQRNA